MAILGRADLLIGPGVSHRVRAEVRGTEITVWVDAREVLKVIDDARAEGRVGVNSFGGRVTNNDIVIR